MRCRKPATPALIAFGLFVLLIGLKTDQNIRNELILVPRWGLLAIIVAITAIGRFVYVAYAAPYFDASRRAAAQRTVQVAPVEHGFIRRNFNVIGLAALFLYPIVIVAAVGFQGSLKWVDNFGIQVLIYVMLAWGLNIVVGLAGLLDLGYVAFYAVGAYAYALLGTAFRPVVLDTAADRRHHGGLLGRHARLSRCCGCAATIWPSSRSPSARSSAWC